MGKDVILTGLRANGEFHIGNYLGAILPMVEMQRQHAGEYQINMFVPDLHSFTTPIDHSKLYRQVIDNLKVFVAAGLDINNPDSFIYRQSYISAHAELTWIFDCFLYYGELSRMTQFKDKSGEHENVSVGLFNYPALMAADILLYGAKYVPLGDDQKQHLELTRDIALRMNNKFGELFVVPYEWPKQLEFTQRQVSVRIRSLRNPEKKMSKSVDDPAGTILLSDSPEDAAKKIMSATTDSVGVIHFDLKEQPGVSNLLQILALLSERPQDEVNAEWEGKTSYGELKQAVADKVKDFLTRFQSKLAEVDEAAVLAKLEQDESTMREVADKTLQRVQKAIGLRPSGKTASSYHDAAPKPSSISFDDFAKLDIRICTVLSAEHAEGSDKLLKLKLNDGNGERQIMTATREFFPDLSILVGKQLPVITNLAPRSFKGHESQGMFLCADVNGQPILMTPVSEVPDGSPIM